jgi:pimeloyl-ACP methyl ester carboxylesterase
MLTRRRLLLAGGPAAVLTAGAAVVERHPLRRLVLGFPSSPHPVPSVGTGALESGSFASQSMSSTIGWTLSFPPGVAQGAPLPLMLVLHGRGGTHRSAFHSHHLDRFQAAAGVRFAIASVDGGDHSYWHRRSSGVDPQAMIISELLPVLARRGVLVDRVALGGWSMGGYGALLLAERLGPSRVACVAADSPALWSRWKDSAPGAFDGPGDFAAHDVIGSLASLRVPVRVSCGTSDPFLPGVRSLLRAVPTVERELGPGAHDEGWWLHAAPAQLAFVARHLPAG